MANKRSAPSQRGRDLFRAEVSSLLADLGDLAEENAPPGGVEEERRAVTGAAAPAPSVRPHGRPRDVTEAAPPPAVPAEIAAPAPTPFAELAPPEAPREASVPAESAAPPAPPPVAFTPPPAPPPAPPGPPVPPPVVAEAPALPPLEDLPSFSPSYLPPLPPVLPAATAAAVAPRPPASPPAVPPPSPPLGWAPPLWEPGFEPIGDSEWPETSGPPPAVEWSASARAARAADQGAVDSASHHPPPPPSAAWPSQTEPPGPETEVHPAGRGLESMLGLGSFFETRVGGWEMPEVEPVTRPTSLETRPHLPKVPAEPTLDSFFETRAPGWEEAEARPGGRKATEPAAESNFETRVGGWEMPEPGHPAPPAGAASAAQPATVSPGLPGFRLRPISAPARTPALAETPSWGTETPPIAPGAHPRSAPDTEADGGQRFRAAPPTDLAPPEEPAGATPADARVIPSPTPPPASGSAVRHEPGLAEPAPDAPPFPAPSPMPSATASGLPTGAPRPGLPLLPGGMPAPVSTRPWSLGAAMQPLAPAAPPPLRPGGAPVAEPSGPSPSRLRRSGLNVPFPVVVALLIAVLAVIVVLILLDFRQ